LNCLPIILNDCCNIDNIEFFYGTDEWHKNSAVHIHYEYKKFFEKYNFECKDLQLLEFAKFCQNDKKSEKMFDALLYFYIVRENWFKIIGQPVSQISGFYWSYNKTLDNNRIPYLIWLANQKPKGIPKLLMYHCIYPYIFTI